MPHTRTQIYLTDEQRARAAERGKSDGTSMAHVIREAVDAYLAEDAPQVDEALDAAFGALPELEAPSRDEWDAPGG